MKFRIFVKLLASLLTVGSLVFTGMLLHHTLVKPKGGVFSQIIPSPGVLSSKTASEFPLNSRDQLSIPDFDPAERPFQKAHELIVMGELDEGYDKLLSIINFHPDSPKAADARYIVGQMNLDCIFSGAFMKGKEIYIVKPGDSYLGILAKNQTNLEMFMYLNHLTSLKNLQPKDELLIFPLNFRLLIEPERKSISVWDNAKFLCEFPIIHWVGAIPKNTTTQISSRRAMLKNQPIQATSEQFLDADKSLLLLSPSLPILGAELVDDNAAPGIYLSKPDMEELYLITREDNEIEIRSPLK